VEAIAARLPHVRIQSPVASILREDDCVHVQDAEGRTTTFDAAVVATHADDALAIVADATREEKEVLGAFRYSRNETVLHTDTRLLPNAPRARASWNYRTTSDRSAPTAVTYWMNRLQGLDSGDQFLVTLNANGRIDPDRIVRTMQYTHPIYDVAAIEAQRRLASISTERLAFAGAYHGWGFHEDGCRSGVDAARALGVAW
jgi:predicted NAD/FAD-binding protein